ncbi:sulfatase-like hydrolase/transferase [Candidatus Marsarchaeota archaeon]|nr:sulfatase-like hydrolase/transferase [Candidatus Marsarchaeota archaeon]MCL5404898.1 sulfatase-like hydrolase/transferase [Candidatus Marsarchaeota archaeon]
MQINNSSKAANKNIIVFLLDTARSDDVYGNKSLKNISNISKKAVVYRNAISPSTWTVPSHASIFTYKKPSEIPQVSKDFMQDSSIDPWYVKIKFLPDNAETIATKLRRMGYYSVLFSNNPFLTSYTNLAIGFDKIYDLWMQSNIKYNPKKAKFLTKFIKGGKRSRAAMYAVTSAITNLFPRPFLDKAYLKLRIKMDIGVARADGTYALDRGAIDTNAALKSYMENYYNYKPQFIFLNCIEAHENYPVADRSIIQDKWLYLSGILEMNDYVIKQLHSAYRKRLVYLDKQISKSIDILKENGILDNAKLIITSDHGQFFGEHSMLYHSMFPYTPVTNVPLIVADYEGGKIASSHRVEEDPISLSEMHNMIMNAAASKQYQNVQRGPVTSEHLGISEGWDSALLSHLGKRSVYASRIYKAKLAFNIRSTAINYKGFKLIHYFGMRKSELYKAEDSSEQEDLLQKYRGVAKRMAVFA